MDENIVLVACRTHFNGAYLAYAQRAESNNYDGFGHNDLSFQTAFDGGGNYNPDNNRMWHFFGDLLYDGKTIVWKVLHKNKVVVIHLQIEQVDHTGWPGVSFEKLQEILFERYSQYLWDNQGPTTNHPEDYLTKRQIQAAKKIEVQYFKLWGQGHGPLF